MIIYKLCNTVTGKSYIGQTVQPLQRRLSGHICDCKSNPWPISRSIKKHGIKNFKIDILCFCLSKEEMDKQETFYIGHYDTIRPNGYNVQYGGGCHYGHKMSDDIRKKMSEMRKGKKPTEEHRKKLSIAQRGIKKPGTSKYIKEKNTCWWKVIVPSKEELVIRDIKNFCKENGLDQGAMSRVAAGKRNHHKQYRCIKLEKEL